MGRIKRLSGAAISQLRSITIISDLAQVVEELVCNSLDAGATQVHTHLEAGTSYLKVEDDGGGISREDLKLVGERHATSKLHHLAELEAGVKTLGFRGEALSSLADISLLEITSRVRGSPHTYCKIIQGQSTVSLGLSGQPHVPGTTVVVRDIFYNQPVRRRLLQCSSENKALQSVKERVLRLALAHPEVSFTITDVTRREQVFQIQRHPSLSGTLQDVFGGELCSGLHEVDYAKGPLRLSGFLSKSFQCHPSKAVHFFYINRRFVHKTPVHKLISAWGSSAVLSRVGPGGPEAGRKGGWDAASGRQGCPVFVLNLRCPFSDYDITFEASKAIVEFKDWTPVLSFVKEVLERSWGHGLIDIKEDIAPELSAKSMDFEAALKPTVHNHKIWQHIDPTYKSSCNLDVFTSNASSTRLPRATPLCRGKLPDGDLSSGSLFVEPVVLRQTRSSQKSNPLESPLKRKRLCSYDHHDKQSKVLEISPLHKPLFKPATLDNQRIQGVSEYEWMTDRRGEALDSNLSSRSCTLLAPSPPRYGSQDVLLSDRDLSVGSPEPFWVASSPVGSDGSWAGGVVEDYQKFDSCEDFAPTQSLNLGSGQVRPVRQCLLSESDESGDLGKTYALQSDQFVRRQTGAVVSVEDGCDTRSILQNGSFESEWMGMNLKQHTGLGDILDELPRPYRRALTQIDTRKGLVPRSASEAQESCSIVNSEVLYCADLLGSPVREHNQMDNNHVDGVVYFERKFQPLQIDSSFWESSSCSNWRLLDTEDLREAEACLQSSTIQPKRAVSGPPFDKFCQTFQLNEDYLHNLPLRADDCVQHKAINYSVQPRETSKGQREDVDEGRHVHEPGVSIAGAQSLSIPQDLLLSKHRLETRSNKSPGHAEEDELRKESVAAMYQVWLNPCMRLDGNNVLDLSSGVLGSSNGFLLPELMTKERLQHARVLQQVDKKFIAVVARDMLLLVDQVNTERFVDKTSSGTCGVHEQHAADERVRLEELRAHVLVVEKKQAISFLDPKQELALGLAEQQTLHTYHEQIENWGWRFQSTSEVKALGKHRNRAKHGGTCKVQLSAVPCILGVSLTAADLEEFLCQLSETHGASAPPPAVVRVLNYKSCRGAIMFGDALLPAECRQLVDQLKQTSLCFQCAHGRPTMVPLVNLHALHRRFGPSSGSIQRVITSVTGAAPVNCVSALEGSRSNVWHSLHTDLMPTLARAQSRLQQAQQT